MESVCLVRKNRVTFIANLNTYVTSCDSLIHFTEQNIEHKELKGCTKGAKGYKEQFSIIEKYLKSFSGFFFENLFFYIQFFNLLLCRSTPSKFIKCTRTQVTPCLRGLFLIGRAISAREHLKDLKFIGIFIQILDNVRSNFVVFDCNYS